MNKKNLIRIGWTDINKDYFEWTLQNHFNLKVFIQDHNYSVHSDVLVISRPEFYNKQTLLKFLDQGFKLIIINLWEARPYVLAKDFEPYLDNILLILGCKTPLDYGWKNILPVPKFFWYNESLMYTCDNRFQYQNYIPNRTNNKLFFMPIKRSKEFRDRIVNKLGEFLDRSIWSYVEQWNNGKHLITRADNPIAKIGWDRQFEEEWYDDTFFTVVVETFAFIQHDLEIEKTGLVFDYCGPCELFVTEKTYKPIAHQHPFVVCGMKGVLSFLKEIGFETYDHIFDESYDNLDFFDDRLDIIYTNIKNFSKEKYFDPMTEHKIRHNYNLFYDRSKVLAGINSELIEPMLEWIDAR